MKFLESLILGLVYGFSEFLPISSTAQLQIIGTIFGNDRVDPVRNLFIHIAVFIAVYTATAKKRMRLDQAHRKYSAKRRNSNSFGTSVAEYNLLRVITISFVVTFLLLYFIWPLSGNLLQVSLCLLINGVIIYFPDRTMQGNKNAKVMSTVEAILVGCVAGLSALSGFSRVGLVLSLAAFCGAERKNSSNWALLLSVCASAVLVLTDIFEIFAGNGEPFWSNLFFNLISAVFAFVGSLAGIYILRKHISKNGGTSYAYYCWGAALLALILFLTVA